MSNEIKRMAGYKDPDPSGMWYIKLGIRRKAKGKTGRQRNGARELMTQGRGRMAKDRRQGSEVARQENSVNFAVLTSCPVSVICIPVDRVNHPNFMKKRETAMKGPVGKAFLLLSAVWIFNGVPCAEAFWNTYKGCSKGCSCQCFCDRKVPGGSGPYSPLKVEFDANGEKKCDWKGQNCGNCYAVQKTWDQANRLCKERNEVECTKRCQNKFGPLSRVTEYKVDCHIP